MLPSMYKSVVENMLNGLNHAGKKFISASQLKGDYYLKANDAAKVAMINNKLNVYSESDFVQPHGDTEIAKTLCGKSRYVRGYFI